MQYPTHLLKLLQVFRKLPGVGGKTAERFAFELVGWKEEELAEMAQLIDTLLRELRHCPDCGCLMAAKESCAFCGNPVRDTSVLCVLASPRDVFAVEQTRQYRGIYHVLGGMLSPLEGRGVCHFDLSRLKDRLHALAVKEVILALDSTVEGDATALFLKRELESEGVHLSRLALGMPMGSSLEYVDGGTLARAVSGRQPF